MTKPSVKPTQRRPPATPAPHPVLDHSAKLRERAQALGLGCKDQVWGGWHAKHRFVCEQGHEHELSPSNLLGSVGTMCPVCRDAAHLKHLQALAAAADAVCLDTRWRGYKAAYHFRCGQGHTWNQNSARKPVCPTCAKAANTGKRLQAGLQRLMQAAQERGGVCLSEGYLGKDAYHSYRCAEGHEWESTEVLYGSWCRLCAHARTTAQLRLTDGLVRLRQAAADRGGLCLSEAYEGTGKLYGFRCAQGHEWRTLGAAILRGRWCRVCSRTQQRQKVMLPDGLAHLQETALANGGVCLSKTYEGHTGRHYFRCKHGHEWATIAKVIFQGSWCVICAHDPQRLGLEAAREIAQARGGQCLSKTYVNVAVKMSWMCDRGHVWQAAFSSIRRGTWCPECAHMAKITNKNSKARARYEAAGQAT